MKICIDVGGTFTDLVLFDEKKGRVVGTTKVSSTPKDPSEGAIHGINSILEESGVEPAHVDFTAHGTTVAVNTLLEHKGASVGLITTKGFRDILELRRISRPKLYDLFQDIPTPLVPRNLRLEVLERVDFQGNVLHPLDPSEVLWAADQLIRRGVESVAISFLFSYINPIHEIKARDIIRKKYANLLVFISSEVNPQIKEYERTSTTVLCSYIGPKVVNYIDR
jgi:N-methylhydantoinase A